jgi:hypothetical protein
VTNLLPYDVTESPDGSVRFSRRKLGWDDAMLALRRRGLGVFMLIAAIGYAVALEAVEHGLLVFGLDPTVVIVGLSAIVLAVGFGTAYALYRRATDSFVFDADRGALRIGRGRSNIPFDRLDGAYCVRDRWTHKDESGAPVENFEVYVRSGERRIHLALVDNRFDADRLTEKLQRLIRGRRA